MKLYEIARIINGSVYGRKAYVIKNILPPDSAGKNDLTFLFDSFQKTRAGAVVAEKRVEGKSGIVVKNPKNALFVLLKNLAEKRRKREISPQSLIAQNVVLPKSCTIEPFAVIKKNVKIGAGTYIAAHCYIDEEVTLGKHCEIMSHTVIYKNTKVGDFVAIGANTVIGKEGFGYIKKRRYTRLKHIGGVVIKNFVDIGGNVTIDRGTIGTTIIGEGTKIDNLVHIAHNVEIGNHCILMGQVGIAGSTKIGSHVILCGQVGVSDHLEIGDNVVVYAKSGVFKSLVRNKKFSGIPAREHSAVLKAIARLYKAS